MARSRLKVKAAASPLSLSCSPTLLGLSPKRAQWPDEGEENESEENATRGLMAELKGAAMERSGREMPGSSTAACEQQPQNRNSSACQGFACQGFASHSSFCMGGKSRHEYYQPPSIVDSRVARAKEANDLLSTDRSHRNLPLEPKRKSRRTSDKIVDCSGETTCNGVATKLPPPEPEVPRLRPGKHKPPPPLLPPLTPPPGMPPEKCSYTINA
mmetsp:Transcript_21587/g.43729  ORF Transcript_21587/g.43729 Transcript_21587/m.43729 type:complete len:214 (-) Transcript_21587:204-845(-)